MAYSNLTGMILPVAILTLLALSGPERAESARVARDCQKLLAAEMQVRLEAQKELKSTRDQVVSALLGNIKSFSTEPERTYNGSFHLTLQAIGEWRVEETVPFLVPMVDITLDRSTFPVGAKFLMEAYYPAAGALAAIGGRSVVREIFKPLKEPAGEEVLRASTWVLKECLGVEVAKATVELALKKAWHDVEKGNLAKVIRLLNSPDTILLWPEG